MDPIRSETNALRIVRQLNHSLGFKERHHLEGAGIVVYVPFRYSIHLYTIGPQDHEGLKGFGHLKTTKNVGCLGPLNLNTFLLGMYTFEFYNGFTMDQ